jgi:ABC-type protease/lipase transport system fused ATPase/permease subunit
VPQDPFLFSARIKENIAFALPTVDEERIRRAAKVASRSRREASEMAITWRAARSAMCMAKRNNSRARRET